MIELQQVIASGQISAAEIEAHRAAGELPENNKTGWPSPELMQDDDRGLSKWLASKPGARQCARDAADKIAGELPIVMFERNKPSLQDIVNNAELYLKLRMTFWGLAPTVGQTWFVWSPPPATPQVGMSYQ